MASIASAERETVTKEQTRKGFSLNRVLHRVGGLFASLLLLWIAGTGTLMQLLDLKAIFSHEPQTTATQLSIQEGMYGPANYAVIQLSDFNAPPLPKDFDINQGVASVLQAAHPSQNQGSGAAGPALAAGGSEQGPRGNAGPGNGRPSGGPGGGSKTGGVEGGNRGVGATGGERAAGGPGGGGPQGGGPGGGPGGGGGGRGQMSSEDRVAAIDKAVTLTADQKAKIKAIYEANQQKAADIRASQDPDMRTKLAALRADQDSRIAAMLSPDQKPKYEAYAASAGPGGGPGGRGPGGGGAGAGTATAAIAPGATAGSAPNGDGGGRSGDRAGGNPGGGPGRGDRAASAQGGAPVAGVAPTGRPRQGGGQGGGAQMNPMAWVEVRMANGQPIGQLMMGTRLEAFNAQTGAAVTPFPPVALPQGRGLPPSLRQKVKTLHRFWDRTDVPGVYVEFFAGLFLLMMTLTGLVMYFRLLGVRFRQGRRSLLWLTGGGWWRGTHRVVSVLAAAFILCIAFSGTWIGFESSFGPIKRALSGAPQRPAGGQPQGQAGQAVGGPGAQGGQGGPGGGGRGRRNPIDFIIPLRDAEVQEMTTVTLASMKQMHPNEVIKAVRLRTFGLVKEGVVISTDGDVTSQYVFNADTGAPDSLNEPGYPVGNFPFGVQVHENMKHFHSGAMFGVSTRVMNLLSGFSLTFLSISGLVVYFDMWLKRRKGGRNSLVWR